MIEKYIIIIIKKLFSGDILNIIINIYGFNIFIC